VIYTILYRIIKNNYLAQFFDAVFVRGLIPFIYKCRQFFKKNIREVIEQIRRPIPASVKKRHEKLAAYIDKFLK
jgi:hypothetical protein